MLDRNQIKSVTFQSCGTSRVGFCSLNDQGGHNHLSIIGGFFVSASGLHSWWLGAGGFGLLGSLITSLQTCIQPPFLFCSRKGEQLDQGGSL